jgi:tetratricopeptide (TPR) repeat protein
MSTSNSESGLEAARAPRNWGPLICIVLALGTAALYWPLSHHPFILFDDQQYVVENTHVNTGLSATNLVWAFTTSEQANWHPLTWLSHQLDCTLFGLDAGRHHLVSLLYHILNALLVFVFLRSATGGLWRCAFVAALFAWHPMHVESVAWASERKDVLSTFFWLLTLLAYLGYARSAAGGAGAKLRRGWLIPAGWYAAALILCAFGLMSKPMVVTLPFVLMLLDLWPLNRIAVFPTWLAQAEVPVCQPVSIGRLIGEKTPFLALAAAGSLTTYLVQSGGGAVAGLPLMQRLDNGVLAYPRYIAKLCWPTDLSIIYMYPRHWPLALALGAVAVLVAWTFLCAYNWRKRPYYLVGWFWFLGTLVPTIGLIQVGSQSMADRYTYIPSIGLFIVVTWAAVDFFAERGSGKAILSVLGSAVLIGYGAATVHQVGLWRDNITLFRHAVESTTDNYVAENCLGSAYELVGDQAHAMVLYRLAVDTEPRFPSSQFKLAMMMLELGQTTNALHHLQVAASLAPHDADIQYDLGIYFSQHNSWTNAINCYSNSLAVRPAFAPAHFRLGNALANLGRAPEAAVHLRAALKLDPALMPAKTNLDRLMTEHPEVR